MNAGQLMAFVVAAASVTGPPDEVWICDGCQEGFPEDEVENCEHGWTRCRECGLCNDCRMEARYP